LTDYLLISREFRDGGFGGQFTIKELVGSTKAAGARVAGVISL